MDHFFLLEFPFLYKDTKATYYGLQNIFGWPVCLLRAMAYRSIYIALLLLLIGHMLAVPEIEPANRNTHIAPCQDHSKLNDRLDAVEKRVEETVQKLEAELATYWMKAMSLHTLEIKQDKERKLAQSACLVLVYSCSEPHRPDWL
ncbi:hypothetical protein PHYPO_G00177290 [Pangasianodon hypophthalmus]|uniref:Uncharacterized protein n=1 Tax=Pangasianodon hypophthalmus TaxID=310915 RepID=A0A5N5PPM7_PANHP|nr:hypothetical protein PHYPO_G00177290 [Pangasianodon hypophthalmus]